MGLPWAVRPSPTDATAEMATHQIRYNGRCEQSFVQQVPVEGTEEFVSTDFVEVLLCTKTSLSVLLQQLHACHSTVRELADLGRELCVDIPKVRYSLTQPYQPYTNATKYHPY